MFVGLGIPSNTAPLTDEEEERFDRYFVYLNGTQPSEFAALPLQEQEEYKAFSRAYHMNRLILTRTATKKQ